MPYELRQVSKRPSRWVVITVATGKPHSKEGMSKKKAQAQLRVLDAALKKRGRGVGDDFVRPPPSSLWEQARRIEAYAKEYLLTHPNETEEVNAWVRKMQQQDVKEALDRDAAARKPYDEKKAERVGAAFVRQPHTSPETTLTKQAEAYGKKYLLTHPDETEEVKAWVFKMWQQNKAEANAHMQAYENQKEVAQKTNDAAMRAMWGEAWDKASGPERVQLEFRAKMIAKYPEWDSYSEATKNAIVRQPFVDKIAEKAGPVFREIIKGMNDPILAEGIQHAYDFLIAGGIELAKAILKGDPKSAFLQILKKSAPAFAYTFTASHKDPTPAALAIRQIAQKIAGGGMTGGKIDSVDWIIEHTPRLLRVLGLFAIDLVNVAGAGGVRTEVLVRRTASDRGQRMSPDEFMALARAQGGGSLHVGEPCPICLQTLTPEDNVRVCRTGHLLHHECLHAIIQGGHRTCPICQRSLLPDMLALGPNMRALNEAYLRSIPLRWYSVSTQVEHTGAIPEDFVPDEGWALNIYGGSILRGTSERHGEIWVVMPWITSSPRDNPDDPYPFDERIFEQEGEGFAASVYHFFTGKYQGEKGLEKFLHTNGEQRIQSIRLFRQPVGGALQKIVNWFTGGDLEAQMGKNSYDKLFHLSMYIELSGGASVTLEKNSAFTTHVGKLQYGVEAQSLAVPMNAHPEMREFIYKAIQRAGAKDFFVYDAFSKNCQDFVYNALQANGLLTPDVADWIRQNLLDVAQKHPAAAKFFTAITDLHGIVTGGNTSLPPPVPPRPSREVLERLGLVPPSPPVPPPVPPRPSREVLERLGLVPPSPQLGRGHRLPAHGTTSEDLSAHLHGLRGFRGIFSADTLPKTLKKHESLITNLQNASEGGSHWVCLAHLGGGQIFYYDPYGGNPDDRVLALIHRSKATPVRNTSQYQSPSSVACGPYCVFALQALEGGRAGKDGLYTLLFETLQPDQFKKNEKIIMSQY